MALPLSAVIDDRCAADYARDPAPLLLTLQAPRDAVGVRPPQQTGGGESDDAVQGLLAEKDAQLQEMAETVDILEVKIQKLEQLVRLKDSKIATLQAKLQQHEGAAR